MANGEETKQEKTPQKPVEIKPDSDLENRICLGKDKSSEDKKQVDQ